MFQGRLAISIWDFILTPFVLFIIFIIAGRNIRQLSEQEPIYEFYLRGLLLRVGGSIVLCIIYVFYYGGGDTINYWGSGIILNKLIFKDFFVYLDIMGGDLSWKNYATFDISTSHPDYMLRDKNAFAVVRFVSPFCLITGNSYVAATALVAWFTYGGIWRMYKVFAELFPAVSRQMAYTCLLVPSVAFWGGGILKDTFTLWGACLFFYGFYKLFIASYSVSRMKYLFLIVLSSYVMISLKPYVFNVLMPTCLLWYITHRIRKIESGFGRALLLPILLIGGSVVVALVINRLGDSLGDFADVNKTVQKAKVTQQDLKRSEYGGNSFDIGNFDGSLGSGLRLFPAAVFAGLFRPTIIDVRNPVMFMSALENLFLLYLFLMTIRKVGLGFFLNTIRTEPILTFAFSFSILMAFAIGLTTSNFGSLVRYRIPVVPFFFTSLYIMQFLKERSDFENDNPGMEYQPEKLDTKTEA